MGIEKYFQKNVSIIKENLSFFVLTLMKKTEPKTASQKRKLTGYNKNVVLQCVAKHS